jgi:hypothetical protein
LNVVNNSIFLEREVGILHSVSDSQIFPIFFLVVGLLVVLDVKADAVNEFCNLGLRLAVQFTDALLEANLEDLTFLFAWLIKDVELARIGYALHVWKVSLDGVIN